MLNLDLGLDSQQTSVTAAALTESGAVGAYNRAVAYALQEGEVCDLCLSLVSIRSKEDAG